MLAFRYRPDVVSPVDVACSVVLHPQATRADLAFCKEQGDWYRPITGKRAAADAWADLIAATRQEDADDKRRLLLAIALGPIQSLLWGDYEPGPTSPLSRLRAADIAIWMAARHDRPVP